MDRKYLGRSTLLGILTSLIVISLAYIIALASGLIFPPFRLFDFVSRLLPGAVITFVIDVMVGAITSLNLGSTSAAAKLVEQSMALIQFIILGGAFGAFMGFLASRNDLQRLPIGGMIAGLILSIGFIGVEISLDSPGGSSPANIVWQVLLFSGWGFGLGWLIQETAIAIRKTEAGEGISRRESLYLGGTALGALFTGLVGFGVFLGNRMDEMEETASADAPVPPSDERFINRPEPVPGTRPEITSNRNFYRIDINTVPPSVDANDWRLELSGLVENPMTLTLDAIRDRPSISQYITLSCISNRVGGDLISASKWTGLRLKDLLDEAGLRSGARELYIESVDGFYESVNMEDMMDERTFLVYAMNDAPLPVEHGFPLRIYIPNHYGMKQPKWITRMEVIDHEGAGYWVDRGWSEEAIVETTSVIDNVIVEENDGETMLSGGIAYAGARGISRAELQVDDGPWNEVELRTPPLSDLMWVQWRYQGPVQAGSHTARIRAYDGNGELQVTEQSSSHPNGATGIHTYSFDV